LIILVILGNNSLPLYGSINRFILTHQFGIDKDYYYLPVPNSFAGLALILRLFTGIPPSSTALSGDDASFIADSSIARAIAFEP